MRYSQLIDIVRDKQPKAIIEIGTWNGDRALEMLNACPSAAYYGFDLFEDATDETDKEEFNVKAHHPTFVVSARLKGYNAKLFKGNTRQTLSDFNEMVDVAFIDGGHSVETIRSDWENIKRIVNPGGVVIFDDYYSGMPDERLDAVGCNRVVADLPHTVLPLKDGVAGGGHCQMVQVNIDEI